MDSSETLVPKCMSTQHPDNVNSPFFAHSAELGGDDEIQEAYYVFSHLGCDEQMWDCEGKEVDNFVVKKLLSRYDHFFSKQRIGEDLFITLRVPNPSVEHNEAKILLEALESIPRSLDTSRLFYGDDRPPIFEVIMPMSASAKCLDRVYRYYRDFVVGKQHVAFKEGDITIADWIGDFGPERINVIPLFEDYNSMMHAHDITREYLEDKDVSRQRVFLARSDPALNYGLVPAVLLNKFALMNLHQLEEDSGIEILPIVGMGSAPFRGNLSPNRVHQVMDEYPSVHTHTAQSSFKYDHYPNEVENAVAAIRDHRRSEPHTVEMPWALDVIDRYAKEYKNQLLKLAPHVNEVSKTVPRRRMRKLHIGLFGYSRSMDGVALPRAIGFTASMYSLGIPPELLGLNALRDRDWEKLDDVMPHYRETLAQVMVYANPNSFLLLPDDLVRALRSLDLDFEPDEDHHRISDSVVNSLKHRRADGMQRLVLRAANQRGFLG